MNEAYEVLMANQELSKVVAEGKGDTWGALWHKRALENLASLRDNKTIAIAKRPNKTFGELISYYFGFNRTIKEYGLHMVEKSNAYIIKVNPPPLPPELAKRIEERKPKWKSTLG